MESKLNLNAIREYSKGFTAEVAAQAFARQEKLGGQAILSLTPVKQVNLFIINDLLNKWRMEIQKIRSPYFNFEEEEVQEALQEFMNTLSQHISVDREHLEPLIEAATLNTLLLLLDPHFFYHQVLSNVQFSLTRETLKDLFKYIRINRLFADLLTQHLQREHKEEIHASYALWLLEDKAGQVEQQQEDADSFLSAFSQIKTVSKESFYPHAVAVPSPARPSVSFENTNKRDREETDKAPKTLNDYLNRSAGSTLADIHQQRRIDSLRSNISVNQRYMFIRELFGNNQEEYHRALTTLEQQNSYAEAFNYLRNEYAHKNRWRMDSEEVIEFLEIISKRYS